MGEHVSLHVVQQVEPAPAHRARVRLHPRIVHLGIGCPTGHFTLTVPRLFIRLVKLFLLDSTCTPSQARLEILSILIYFLYQVTVLKTGSKEFLVAKSREHTPKPDTSRHQDESNCKVPSKRLKNAKHTGDLVDWDRRREKGIRGRLRVARY